MTKVFALALIASGLVLTSRVSAEELPGGKCLECHSTLEDGVAEVWQDDVHAHAGIGCDGCHGGDSTQDDSDLAKRRGTGYRGKLSPQEIILSCGGCHGDIEYM
ncbi:MAG: cytochrome C, partial [Myxococcales bacterium]